MVLLQALWKFQGMEEIIHLFWAATFCYGREKGIKVNCRFLMYDPHCKIS